MFNIGALYDNRALEGEGLVGPIQETRNASIRINSASSVDLRAVLCTRSTVMRQPARCQR